MKRLSISSEVGNVNALPEVEDVELSSGKVVRVRRKHYNPNLEDPVWQRYQLQAIQSYLTPTDKRRPSLPKRELLLKYDHMEDALEHRKNTINYNPTVPLPAYYEPPDEIKDVPFYYDDDFQPNPNQQLYPLVILQTHPNAAVFPEQIEQHQHHFVPATTSVTSQLVAKEKRSAYCDRRACKIASCIILISVVAMGAFVAYIVYNKYCCWK